MHVIRKYNAKPQTICIFFYLKVGSIRKYTGSDKYFFQSILYFTCSIKLVQMRSSESVNITEMIL